MKVKIVSLETVTNQKTGQVTKIVKALADVVDYGRKTVDLISIKVDTFEGLKIGEADLDILLPKINYPYILNDNKKGNQ